MAKYNGSINGVALSTSADLRTLVTTATGVARVYEISLSGESGSSAVARVAVNRPSANGTTPTNQTPEKTDPHSPAATCTFATTWAAQPTLSSNDLLELAFNAFGGVYRWVAIPDSELVVDGLNAVANLSIRSRSGTSTVSGHVLWEER